MELFTKMSQICYVTVGGGQKRSLKTVTKEGAGSKKCQIERYITVERADYNC